MDGRVQAESFGSQRPLGLHLLELTRPTLSQAVIRPRIHEQNPIWESHLGSVPNLESAVGIKTYISGNCEIPSIPGAQS